MNRGHIIHIFIGTFTLVSAVVWTSKGKQERGALSYVVQRGCPYLSRYVRENYFIDDELETNTATSVPTAVNWVTYTYDRCSTEYVPTELFHGLVNCGKVYALFAVKAPTALIELLGIGYTFSQIASIQYGIGSTTFLNLLYPIWVLNPPGVPICLYPIWVLNPPRFPSYLYSSSFRLGLLLPEVYRKKPHPQVVQSNIKM
ncbi:hypothetical protein ACJMK2_042173 [Sinanodonta woodiana]|uniref:Uncharacterized protein n=1 Tax=Sinanodonta woodiana TaxID=1069815 RepID=A0ABD3WAB9_SINWO